ncbi:hypothetical protein HYALB_00004967 [Hymenoscyphus albidus]|uniref:Uncharacterized protein n=1 Tax=Hymenoscyphus albidus TaxID=595503 RepID=A0A9N9Q4K8_9HELO|nr:hypothetical protein HYALB_00004967 [Hymenoscyphus albidus]
MDPSHVGFPPQHISQAPFVSSVGASVGMEMNNMNNMNTMNDMNDMKTMDNMNSTNSMITMSSMNVMGLERGLEVGYTCPRCSWGKREHSTRLMSLSTLQKHAQTVHHVQPHAMEKFVSEANRQERRPSAPQTPVPALQPYAPPPQINASGAMGIQQHQQHQQHQQYNTGPSPQHHVASPHISQAPRYMNPAVPQGFVVHTTDGTNIPQVPAEILEKIPPNYQLVVQQLEPNQMASRPPQFPPSSQAPAGQVNQNPGQYWGPAQVSRSHLVQMPTSFQHTTAPPLGYMTQANTLPISTQGPGGCNFQPPNQPQGLAQTTLSQQAIPNYPHLSIESNAKVENVRQLMDQFHHACETRGHINAADNPVIYNGITYAEVKHFEKYWMKFDPHEKMALQNRLPYVYEAMLRQRSRPNGQPGVPPQRQVSSPVQYAVNNTANITQPINVISTNYHNPPTSIKQGPGTPVQQSPLQKPVDPNAPPQNTNADRPMPSGSGARGPGNPKMNPNYDVQNMLRKRSLSFQNQPNATNPQTQPAYRSDLQTSRGLLRVNESGSQGPLVSNVQTVSPTLESINPAPVNMQNTNPHKGKTNQDFNPNAGFTSSAQAHKVCTGNSANPTTPSIGSISTTRSGPDGYINTQNPQTGQSGGTQNVQSMSQICSGTESLKANATLARKRQFGSYQENSESTASEDATVKKPRLSSSINPGSIPQTPGSSQRSGGLGPNLSANTTRHVLAGPSRVNSMSSPARPNSQQLPNKSRAQPPAHNLGDEQYRQFLKQAHPTCGVDSFWSYEEFRRGLRAPGKSLNNLKRMFQAHFMVEHQDKLKAYGLCPSFDALIDLSKMDQLQTKTYKETWAVELTSLMVARLAKVEQMKRNVHQADLQRELNRREEERVAEEERKLAVYAKRNAEYERHVEAEKQKAKEERRRKDEIFKRAEEERKKKRLNEMKERVPEKKALYGMLKASTVGCDPIFQLPDEREFVKDELKECFEAFFHIESITAEGWEFINPSDPHPIYRLD